LSIQLILIGCLGVSILIFFMQCVMQLGLKMDAGLVFGFSFFFDLTGYFFKTYVHGSSLFLLCAVPMILVVVAFLHKPMLTEDLFTNQGLKLWFIFLGYSIVSLGWAFNDSLGFSKVLILFIHGVIPGIYTFIIYKKYKTFSWTTVLLFGLAYSIVHHFFAIYTAEYPGRLTLPGGNPIFDARILFAAVTIALWGKRIPLLLRLTTIGFGIVSGIATQSRGPLLALVIANILVLMYVLYKKYKNGQLQISNVLKIGVFVLLIMTGFLAWQFKDQMQEVIGGSRFTVLVNQNQLVGDANFLGRKYLQMAALDKFIEHPFFGTGLGGDSVMGKFLYPHNIILEIASELGFVGITLWLIAFLYSCFVAKHSAVLLVLLIQTMISALFSGDFGFNYEYILVAITALALSPKRKVKDVDGHGKNHLYIDRFGLRRSGSASHPISNRTAT
jgi:O-antigen ligase